MNPNRLRILIFSFTNIGSPDKRSRSTLDPLQPIAPTSPDDKRKPFAFREKSPDSTSELLRRRQRDLSSMLRDALPRAAGSRLRLSQVRRRTLR
jgi:hypothetical protein